MTSITEHILCVRTERRENTNEKTKERKRMRLNASKALGSMKNNINNVASNKEGMG